MHKHCKDCISHHNAGHHSTRGITPWKKYNDWCCQYSKKAKDSIGECKLKNGKKLKGDVK
jgi:hypothetical protein